MPMDEEPDFYTQKGYQMRSDKPVTSAMEDYLEMICRMSEQSKVVRISSLAQALHVKPPSASKMAGNLRAQELIEFPRYGYITLTPMGKKLGEYLVQRHETIGRLLCLINGTQDELEEVEKIEHFLSPRTVLNIRKFLEQQEKK